MSRKPLPTKLKLLKGTAQKCRTNNAEPNTKPLTDLTPPDYLGEIAADEWRRKSAQLSEMGVLGEVDDAALAAYCRAYERWVEAERLLKEEASPVLSTKEGNLIQHPLVGIANRAMELMLRFMSEFGMTPSSRTRIKVEKKPDVDPMSDFLRRRHG